jgi:hypothetical protein
MELKYKLAMLQHVMLRDFDASDLPVSSIMPCVHVSRMSICGLDGWQEAALSEGPNASTRK